MNGSKWWVSGAVGFVLAALTAMLTLNSKVDERQTAFQVEHLIDLKTQAQYAEIIRRLENVERHLGYPPQVELPRQRR